MSEEELSNGSGPDDTEETSRVWTRIPPKFVSKPFPVSDSVTIGLYM